MFPATVVELIILLVNVGFLFYRRRASLEAIPCFEMLGIQVGIFKSFGGKKRVLMEGNPLCCTPPCECVTLCDS
jgi:hypothetical protein